MPDEDKNFGGSLVLDFRKWWRHVKTIYRYGGETSGSEQKKCDPVDWALLKQTDSAGFRSLSVELQFLQKFHETPLYMH